MRQQSSLSLRSVSVLAVLPALPHAGSVLSAAVAVVIAAALIVVVAGLAYLGYVLWRDWVPGSKAHHGPREPAAAPRDPRTGRG